MAFVLKNWQDRPPELDPLEGESLRAWFARIVAYDEQNPGVLTHLDAAAHIDLETRLSDYTDEQIAAMDLSAYATLASPVFTGSIGLPVYTLATRPAASVGQGRLIFISDAANGGKLQWSNGTTWQSVLAILSNLSADTPDKLIWTTASGNVAEVYGSRTPQGTIFASNFIEEWNSIGPEWTAVGTENFRIAGGQLETTLNGAYYGFLKRGPSVSTLRVAARFATVWQSPPGTGSGGHIGIGFVIDDQNAIVAGCSGDGTLRIHKLTATSLANMTGVGMTELVNQPGAATGSPAYFRLTKNGAQLTFEAFAGDVIADPALAPTRSLSYTLTGSGPGGDATIFSGSGQAIAFEAGLQNGMTQFGNVVMDRIALETVSNELREVLAAVTSIGGVRTVRRVLGFDGGILASNLPLDPETYTTATRPDPAQVRKGRIIFVQDATAGQQWQVSDGGAWLIINTGTGYAPLASPSFTGSVGLPVYTIATRPAATIGAGKMVWVSDAAAGTRLQTSDGAAWNPHLSAALLTAKGDLIGATGAGVAARITATGVAGNVLTEDPTVATGWKSAAPPAGGGGGGGTPTGAALPAITGEGQEFILTSQPGNPTYKVVGGAWEQQPRMGAQNVPSVRATKTALQAIPNAAETVLAFDAEDFDTDSMHDPATNNSRLTIKTPGTYLLTAGAGYAPGGGGISRQFAFVKNGVGGATRLAYFDGPIVASGTKYLEMATVVQLSAGDYIELSFYQDSGGSLNAREPAYLGATWLGGAGQTVDERGVPAVKATHTGGVALPAGVATALPWDTDVFNTDGMHNIAVNNTRFTAKTPGLYDIDWLIELQAPPAASGSKWVEIRVNGGSLSQYTYMDPKFSTDGRVRLLLAAGDYFELVAHTDTALATLTAGQSRISAALVGSGKTVTPFARVGKSADQSVPSGVPTMLSFDTEAANNDGIHDTATNNTRLTARTAGVYMIQGAVGWASNATATREVLLRLNGASNVAYDDRPPIGAGSLTIHPVSTIVELAVGDYIELRGYQDSGGAINALAAYTYLSMVKVGAPNAGNTGIEAIPGWTPLVLKNGWTTIGADHAAPAYRIDRGVVRFRGAIKPGGTDANAFDLPAGAVPAGVYTEVQMMYWDNAGAVNRPGLFQVDGVNAGGNVKVYNNVDGTPVAGGATVYYLEGLTYAL